MRKSVIFLSVFVAVLGGVAQAEDKKLKESEVPKPVIEKVKQKYTAAKLLGFEQETEDGKTSYEVKLEAGGRQLEVSCSADGKILSEEEKIALEVVPEKVRKALTASARYGTWTVRSAERVIVDEKTEAPTFELKVVNGSAGAELVFTADGELTKTEEKELHEKKKAR